MPQIFPVAIRQPGVAVSGPQSVPAGAANKTYLILTQIAQADLDDPTVSFELRMYVRNPDGTWPAEDGFNAGITFLGGPNQGKGGAATRAPGWMQSGAEVAGQVVRFWLNVTGRAFDAGLAADPQ